MFLALLGAGVVPQIAGAAGDQAEGATSEVTQTQEATQAPEVSEAPEDGAEAVDSAPQGKLEADTPLLNGTSEEAWDNGLELSPEDELPEAVRAGEDYCAPGVYYSVGNFSGRITKWIDGQQDPVWTIDGAPFYTDLLEQVNGVGVTRDGKVYVIAKFYQRNPHWNNGTYYQWRRWIAVWVYDLANPRDGWNELSWMNVGSNYIGDNSLNWVAGAVDPSTGDYYFGQYTRASIAPGYYGGDIEVGFRLYKVD